MIQMSAEDDPKHPLWPTFETLEDVAQRGWVVLYEGLTGRWLASGIFYDYNNAIWFGSQFSRGVRILELSVTDMQDLPIKDRLPHRQKKVRKVRAVVAPPPVVTKKVRRVRRVVEESE
jgi:hypothetical protein